jgi:hypothetical protein
MTTHAKLECQQAERIERIAFFSVLLLAVGCTSLEQGDKGSKEPVNSVAIVVALTKVDYEAYGGWDGRCAGSDTDLNRMVQTFEKAGIERVVALYNEKATTYAVIRQILLASKALEASAKAGKRPLLAFYFSGHGAQAYDFFRKEQNSMNQTLCLWDGQMVDDLMWDVLLKIPQGIRGAGPFIAREYKNLLYRPRLTRRLPSDLSCDFIHFGGCADGAFSRGNVTYGGIFSYALIEKIKPEGKSYYQWFEEAKAYVSKTGQIPVMDVIQSETSIFNNGRMEDAPALK